MRVLGLDVGDRRIGVALSDALGVTAQPLTVMTRGGLTQDLNAICALAAQHQAEAIVVGLPLTMRGEQGPQAKKVMAFAEALRRRLSISVQFIDERLTTVQGERALLETDTPRRRRKQLIDQVAAQLILQQFLDVHARSRHE